MTLRPVTNTYAPDVRFEPSRLARLTHDLRDPLDYLYCVCCERAYQRGYSRHVDGRQLCPFDGCDGDAMEDACPWQAIARMHPACYPRIPQIGKVYPMFGASGEA